MALDRTPVCIRKLRTRLAAANRVHRLFRYSVIRFLALLCPVLPKIVGGYRNWDLQKQDNSYTPSAAEQDRSEPRRRTQNP